MVEEKEESSMRLNLDDPNIWNQWRELYYDLTHEENIQFGNDIEARYPGQQSYTLSNFDTVFGSPSLLPTRVLEIGGWKGELAQHCLSKYNISSWLNIDMCKAAVDKSVCKDPRYTALFPDRFDWFAEKRVNDFDVCVSAHTIEHLSDRHLEQLIEHISGIPCVVFEAPISSGKNNWNGYQGTHILEHGWIDICAIMLVHGYRSHKLNDHCYLFWKAK